MVHLVVGLFKNKKQATDAILELKASKSSGDISLISKEKVSEKIHVHQVKEIPTEEMSGGEKRGAAIGIVGGVLIGLFLVPAAEIAVALGFAGATIGTLAGAILGSFNKAGLHPERAKMYRDKIKKGEIFVCVSTSAQHEEELKSIFAKHKASDIDSITSKK